MVLVSISASLSTIMSVVDIIASDCRMVFASTLSISLIAVSVVTSVGRDVVSPDCCMVFVSTETLFNKAKVVVSDGASVTVTLSVPGIVGSDVPLDVGVVVIGTPAFPACVVDEAACVVSVFVFNDDSTRSRALLLVVDSMVDNVSVGVILMLVDALNSTDSVVKSSGVFVIALSGVVVPIDISEVRTGVLWSDDEGAVTSFDPGFVGVGAVIEVDSGLFSVTNVEVNETSADWVVVIMSTVDSEEGIVAIDAVVVVVVVVVVVGLAESLLAVSLLAPLSTVALESTFVNPPISLCC